ncbi:MAG TPA: ABC transporter ATP-binding protein [Thermoanaerobaculia bacterium]|nr:ABC transporter ATP-binding protein [Thermoanaerobaculia bacterium]
MRVAVEAEHLSKKYLLGMAEDLRYRTLRDSVAAFLRGGLWRSARREIWALQDVSFAIEEGEAFGIIGKNGAGKSTLLKILSRITEPTKGRARLHGRVASLLEVGTGFHPELTGRENIFLNGAILGMSRSEIRRLFDEIVAFAEVEEFLDTPVKRYSSGMYVRLAFAVAAHLTPEILLIDEVLAVGDIEFQRRCLGRMGEVARSGRTVVFVSHNLASIEDLCSRSMLLKRGEIVRIGETRDVVGAYLAQASGESVWDFSDTVEREGTGRARITRLELLHATDELAIDSVPFGSPFRIRLHFFSHSRISDPDFGVSLLTERNERLFLSYTRDVGITIRAIEGEGSCECLVRSPNILPGTYRLEAWISDIPNVSYADHLRMVGKVQITADSPEIQNVGRLLVPHRGKIYVDCDWKVAG